jgi:hypothetical protein
VRKIFYHPYYKKNLPVREGLGQLVSDCKKNY